MNEVARLLTSYCDAIDAGDFDRLGELFRHGALADGDGNVIASGADEVAAFYRSLVILHDGSPRTKHLVLHTVADDATDGSITVRSSYLVLQALDGAIEPIVTGRYVDRVERRDGELVFVERRFFIDLAGDLSRHLRS